MTKFMDDLNDRDEAGLVEEGRTLASTVARSQLRLGKLALAFAPMGDRGARTGAVERVRMFAERIGAEPSAITLFRTVAHSWSPTDLREDEFSFNILKELTAVARKEDALRILRTEEPEGGWTTRTALEAMVAEDIAPKAKLASYERANVKATVRSKSPVDRLAHVRRLLAGIKLSDLSDDERAPVLRELTLINGEYKRLHTLANPPRQAKAPAKALAGTSA